MILLIIAILLSYILFPIGFIYSIIKSIVKNKLYNYFFTVAIAIDQLGNKICVELFNDFLITKDGYKFGHVDETISSAMGRNVLKNTLSPIGKLLDKILNLIDKDHCTKSIE